ncbi:uncharacterized protein V1518DRAFT_408659 [Limtongia smithiae]|uniref:uncharacterized protein n=1 Tax=Limtongia smithiae TaxID=1125753 RepID=UPI0034CEB541
MSSNPRYKPFGSSSSASSSSLPQRAGSNAPAPPSSYGAANHGVHSPLAFDLDAAIAQQQSAYIPKSMMSAAAAASSASTSASSTAAAATAPKLQVGVDGKRVTVIREGGGRKWEDQSLLEWDPAHFRLFVGNLGGDISDPALLKAFAKYPSVSKARVIKDKLSGKNKGYGFVAFKDSDDYFRAFKEMNGKYIGSHPVLLRKAQTEIKAKSVKGSKPYQKATSDILKQASTHSIKKKH